MATKFYLFCIGALLVFQSCNSQPKEKVEGNKPTTLNAELLNDWQKDKDGCLKLRSDRLATTLLEKNRLANATKEEVLKVFGNPNVTETREGKEVLIYYFDTVCRDGKLVKTGDKCYANFYFDNRHLKYQEFICE